MTKKRGSSLVAALLLLSLLLVLGMALLSQRVSQGRTVVEERLAARARQLALAGIADVQAKLQNDINFPPVLKPQEQVFAYTEAVRSLDGTEVIGYYTVTLEGRYQAAYQVLRLRSVGTLGTDLKTPLAESTVSADFDLAAQARHSSGPNPYFYRLRTFRD